MENHIVHKSAGRRLKILWHLDSVVSLIAISELITRGRTSAILWNHLNNLNYDKVLIKVNIVTIFVARVRGYRHTIWSPRHSCSCDIYSWCVKNEQTNTHATQFEQYTLRNREFVLILFIRSVGNRHEILLNWLIGSIIPIGIVHSWVCWMNESQIR